MHSKLGDADSFLISQNDIDNDTFFHEDPSSSNLPGNMDKRDLSGKTSSMQPVDILQESPQRMTRQRSLIRQQSLTKGSLAGGLTNANNQSSI